MPMQPNLPSLPNLPRVFRLLVLTLLLLSLIAPKVTIAAVNSSVAAHPHTTAVVTPYHHDPAMALPAADIHQPYVHPAQGDFLHGELLHEEFASTHVHPEHHHHAHHDSSHHGNAYRGDAANAQRNAYHHANSSFDATADPALTPYELAYLQNTEETAWQQDPAVQETFRFYYLANSQGFFSTLTQADRAIIFRHLNITGNAITTVTDLFATMEQDGFTISTSIALITIMSRGFDYATAQDVFNTATTANASGQTTQPQIFEGFTSDVNAGVNITPGEYPQAYPQQFAEHDVHAAAFFDAENNQTEQPAPPTCPACPANPTHR